MGVRVGSALARLIMASCVFSTACTAAGLGAASLPEDELELDEFEIRTPDERDLEPEDPGTSADERCLEQPELAGVPVDPAAQPAGGQLLSRSADGTWIGLPLQHTAFDSVVVGTVAETLVTQRFRNPLDEPAQVVYVFPLPNEAAVDDYWIRVDDRRIRGRIAEREAAREIYEKARAQGHTAGLLEQERPNVFTQSLANVPARGEIEVTIHLVQALRQDDGRFSLVFPTVVGPRYAGEHNPPSLGTMPRRCGRLDVTVSIDAGVPIDDVRSRAHPVAARHDGDELFVELSRQESRLDRDFELSWAISGNAAQASLQLQPQDNGGGYFTLSLHPPAPDAATIPPREIVFVVDASGSMSGEPLDTAKAAMRRFLTGMGPQDAFQIVRFSDDASAFGNELVDATDENIERGLAYMQDLASEGGTDMTAGIRAALALPGRPGRVRMVMFLTDGYIGDEASVLALIDRHIGEARLFSLGVGSSVNRFLLDSMALVGRGAVTYVDVGETPDAVVDRFYAQIGRPAITDVEIDWGRLEAVDVTPGRLPDLFVGRPLVAFGRYSGAVPTRVKVRGRVGNETVEIPVPVRVAARHGRADGLRALWARHRIGELELSLLDEASSRRANRVDREILALSLEHRVLNERTAFVAVDAGARVDRVDQGQTIVQAVDGIAGMAWEQTSGHVPGPDEDDGGDGLGAGAGGGTGSGYGSGSGAGFGGRGSRVPHVRQARATVRGGRRERGGHVIIKRIVRAHINEIRGCYNQTLVRDPNAHGRVLVSFVIGQDGLVSSVVIAQSELEDAGLHRCMASAVERWKFPKSADVGLTVVNYPFVLALDEHAG